MKSLGFILAHLSTTDGRRNLKILAWMHVLLVAFVAVYSITFHELMDAEGQSHSWFTSVYWTVVTMSTLGYGDIAFTSDAGRLFSLVVLISGAAFILVLLPFTFIQFVFVPTMDAHRRSRAPREVPASLSGHVVLTAHGPIEAALIRRLDRAGIGHVTVVPALDDALALHDSGLPVLVGELDDPDTYRAAGADRAVLVAATTSDTTNTNVAFTAREAAPEVAVVATVDRRASHDVLELAGCDQVLNLGDMLGADLARRVLLPSGRHQVIGQIGDLCIAEAAAPPQLVGSPLADSGLRQRTGLSVAGLWARGELTVGRPETVLRAGATLILAGSADQLARYDELYGSSEDVDDDRPVVILGGGRVGRATGRALEGAGRPFRIVELDPAKVRDPDDYVVGDAADLEVLHEAGIRRAPAVIVTTHDDDTNVYLTLYCRRLRADVQIVARARLDRNVSTLHRAGADSVLSYAATGATSLWNAVDTGATVQIAEGLDVFRTPVPDELVGSTLATGRIRERTGCTVVAVTVDGRLVPNPDPHEPLEAGSELVLIGDDSAEAAFLAQFGPRRRRRRRRLARTG